MTVAPSSVYALPTLSSILGTPDSSNDGTLLDRLLNSNDGIKSLSDATAAITGRAGGSSTASSSPSPSPAPSPAAKSFGSSIGSGGLLSKFFGGGRKLSQANVWIPGIVNVRVDDKGNTNVGLGPGGLFRISGKGESALPRASLIMPGHTRVLLPRQGMPCQWHGMAVP